MRKEFKVKLNGDGSRGDSTASFTLPFDAREVWGKAKVPVKVTINDYTWRSTVGNRDGIQYIVVNADARRGAGVKAGDFVTITLAPDSEKREIEIPTELQKALGTKLTQRLILHPQERIRRVVFRSEEGGHTRPPSREDEADALRWGGH
jgi:Domain of unknown function (DUF1905)